MSEDTIKSITEDFKSLLIESQKYLQGKKALKQYAAIVKASKEEYQRCLNENQQIKKELTNMKIILNSNSNKDTTNSNKNLFNNKRNF